MADGLSTRYKDLLSGSYDCVDRIVLNAYFRMAHSAGGFRIWWRALTGSDEDLDDAHLMRLAGRFSRRLRAYAKLHGIPVIDCAAGERKDEVVDDYLGKTKITCGLFLILVGRAQAPVWHVMSNHHLTRRDPMPYVNHYFFHILDPDWGHMIFRISGHPPFPVQIILNGHEYVACQARKAGIVFTKEANCFTNMSDAAGLAKIADTLSEVSAIGRLSQICERWIYTACLCFALDLAEQKKSGFHYQYSHYQIEYSRNLIFDLGHQMDQVFQALTDRSRSALNVAAAKTILGYKTRPRYPKRKGRSSEWTVTVERPTYDLTVFTLHCGKITLKMYTKGERVLRSEAIAHNTEELDIGRSLEKFPECVARLKDMLERFLNVLGCIDQCFISDSMLDQLPTASQVGKTKVGGLDLNKTRVLAVAQAVIALAPTPRGFTASQLAAEVRRASGQGETQYGPRRAAYDLKKLRGKQIVQRIGKTRRYETIPTGLKAITALLVLRDKAIKPLLAAAVEARPSRGTQNPHGIDSYYETIRVAMKGVFQELGVAA